MLHCQGCCQRMSFIKSFLEYLQLPATIVQNIFNTERKLSPANACETLCVNKRSRNQRNQCRLRPPTVLLRLHFFVGTCLRDNGKMTSHAGDEGDM